MSQVKALQLADVPQHLPGELTGEWTPTASAVSISDWLIEVGPVVGVQGTMAAGYTSQATASRGWR